MTFSSHSRLALASDVAGVVDLGPVLRANVLDVTQPVVDQPELGRPRAPRARRRSHNGRRRSRASRAARRRHTAAPTGSSGPCARRRWRRCGGRRARPGRSPTISLAGTRLSEQPIQRYSGACWDFNFEKKSGCRATHAAAQRRLFSNNSGRTRTSPPTELGVSPTASLGRGFRRVAAFLTNRGYTPDSGSQDFITNRGFSRILADPSPSTTSRGLSRRLADSSQLRVADSRGDSRIFFTLNTSRGFARRLADS